METIFAAGTAPGWETFSLAWAVGAAVLFALVARAAIRKKRVGPTVSGLAVAVLFFFSPVYSYITEVAAIRATPTNEWVMIGHGNRELGRIPSSDSRSVEIGHGDRTESVASRRNRRKASSINHLVISTPNATWFTVSLNPEEADRTKDLLVARSGARATSSAAFSEDQGLADVNIIVQIIMIAVIGLVSLVEAERYYRTHRRPRTSFSPSENMLTRFRSPRETNFRLVTNAALLVLTPSMLFVGLMSGVILYEQSAFTALALVGTFFLFWGIIVLGMRWYVRRRYLNEAAVVMKNDTVIVRSAERLFRPSEYRISFAQIKSCAPVQSWSQKMFDLWQVAIDYSESIEHDEDGSAQEERSVVFGICEKKSADDLARAITEAVRKARPDALRKE